MPAVRIDPDYLSPSNEDGAAASLPTFYAEVIAAINEHADDIDEGGGGDALLVTAFGAVGDGVTDDRDSIASALAAAIAQQKRLHFPEGTYLIGGSITVSALNGLKITGREAEIRYASATPQGEDPPPNALEFGALSTRVRVSGLRFTGDAENDLEVNSGAALYFASGATDIDIRDSFFDYCRPVMAASGDATTGRFSFVGNRVSNAPNAISTSQWSFIYGNWFVNDELVETRGQAVYIYGSAEGGIIWGNTCVNIAGPDIQWRAGDSRWNQKRHCIVGGNHFWNSGTYSVYIATDSTVAVGSAIVIGNDHHNVTSMINVAGCREPMVANNIGDWDFEFAGSLGGANSAIVLGHSGPTLTGHINPSTNARVFGNVLTQRHPWVGFVDFASIPLAGETITVGAETYTWVAGAAGANEVTIGGTIQASISALMTTLRGYDATAQNVVLRDATDTFTNDYTTNGAINTRLVIVSAGDFVLTEVSGSMTCTAPVHMATSCPSPLSAVAAHYPVIEHNTFSDFPNQAAIQYCIEPRIAGNNLTGTALFCNGNVLSTIDGNTFHRTDASDARQLLPYRYLTCTDAFPILRNNGLTCEQERNTAELGGAVGTVTVGDGRARMFLYYGHELVTDPVEPHCIPFCWMEGDEVQVDDGGGIATTFTFKRDTPGAGEFNDADSLIALINAMGTVSADYAYYYDAGSTPEPGLMLELKIVAPGVAGNNGAVWVNTRSKTCGVILRNKIAAEDMARFYGGSAITSGTGTIPDPYLGATRTVVFSRLAGTTTAVHVQGYDSGADGLNPKAYPGSAVPGVCQVLEHDATTDAAHKLVFALSTT
jgi:hypothetical protein